MTDSNNQSIMRLIKLLSVVVPGVVALLIFYPQKIDLGDWIYYLPGFNATLNSITSVLLVSAFYFVMKGNIKMHRSLMTVCFILGVIFLLSYITYHSAAPSTIFGDLNADGILDDNEGALVDSSRTWYVILLLSHIALSIMVVPLVLMTFYYSLNNKIANHKKIVRYTLPVWLYVSITGVIVYIMISPYYMI
jgi:putative membrane protein